jgi:hypothetical protein
LIWREFSNTGNAISAAVLMLMTMVASEFPLSLLKVGISLIPRKLCSIQIGQTIPLESVGRFGELLDSFKGSESGYGRVFVRYSRPEDKLRVLVKAQSEHIVEERCGTCEHSLRTAQAAEIGSFQRPNCDCPHQTDLHIHGVRALAQGAFPDLPNFKEIERFADGDPPAIAGYRRLSEVAFGARLYGVAEFVIQLFHRRIAVEAKPFGDALRVANSMLKNDLDNEETKNMVWRASVDNSSNKT